MTKITELLLSLNKYSRPGRRLDAQLGLIYHYVGIRHQRPLSVYNYFEKDCPQMSRYSSAHYCIDQEGTIFRFVPDHEAAYHCGTDNPDPSSKKVYTDWARKRFPNYAMNPEKTSPNLCTIGIELCFNGVNGEFTEPTLKAAAELGASLCDKYKIPFDNIGTHHHVVGWKECPIFWAKHPEEFDRFRNRITGLVKGRQ